MPTTADYEQVPSSPLLYLLSCASIFVAWRFCWFMLICVVHPSYNLWMILNQSWNTYNYTYVSKLDRFRLYDIDSHAYYYSMQILAVCCCLITTLCQTQPRGCWSLMVFQELVQFCRNTLFLCSFAVFLTECHFRKWLFRTGGNILQVSTEWLNLLCNLVHTYRVR